MSQPVHVAVGVILNAQQQILIALRHDSSHQGGLWEFPGGKVEANESVQQALARELEEELGIITQRLQPLTQIHHDYGDKTVHLDVWWVTAFSGEPLGREGQPLKWVAAAELTAFDFPKANKPIIDAVLQSLS
ncbi:8-oxo-dGTP diphosphatase MutT [Dasania marina]|uniref:8-oxo-dGTP diphosphatase MutT n=1 Tax=Dasania marina TaxID=471499 RepID=UPI0030D979FB|tara:strand:+ start:42974 stop:43372 length:399 start_codon:yes stop_codon:yes gene_type:complete